MAVRVALPEDAEAILDIYGPTVRETVISFEIEPPGLEAMRDRIVTTLEVLPWLVAEDPAGGVNRVIGYAYARPHRDRAAYRWAADVSVYVRPEVHRRGVARALYTALLDILQDQGIRNAYAGIALPNPASVSLHEGFGFRPVGIYRSVGFKQGRWIDVGWWERFLGEHGEAPSEPVPFREFRKRAGLARVLSPAR